jgi:hypothetical protein
MLILSLSDWRWKEADCGVGPYARFDHSMLVVGNYVLLFGGKDAR